MKEGKLVHSTNSGRYAIDDPQTGDEIGKGQICDIFRHHPGLCVEVLAFPKEENEEILQA